jgi:hypothetical protein
MPDPLWTGLAEDASPSSAVACLSPTNQPKSQTDSGSAAWLAPRRYNVPIGCVRSVLRMVLLRRARSHVSGLTSRSANLTFQELLCRADGLELLIRPLHQQFTEVAELSVLAVSEFLKLVF